MECDQIKSAILAGNERRVLDFLGRPDSQYLKLARTIWLSYKGKERFADWRDLFWAAFDRFAMRIKKKEVVQEHLKNLEASLKTVENAEDKKKIVEEIKMLSGMKKNKPVEDCLAYFKDLCYRICTEKVKYRFEELKDGKTFIYEEDASTEPLWKIMEFAISRLGDTCRQLLTARFYENINDNHVLSEMTGGKVSPNSISPTITDCKKKLKILVQGFDLDDFE
jgi:truncated hemoglobin YjbI